MNQARLPLAVLASLLFHVAIGSGMLRAFHSVPSAVVSTDQRIAVTLWNAPSAPAEVVAAPVAAKSSRVKRVTAVVPLVAPVGEASEVSRGTDQPAAAPEGEFAATTVSAPTVGGGVDLFPLNQKLRNAARSCYPQVAARFGLHGTAKVAFCVGNQGEVSQVRLVQSTGSGVLDAAAGGCVLDRARPLPVETSGRCFELPVQFEAGT